MMDLPKPIEPMIAFAQTLRANGFAVSPDQTEGFIAAVGLLGPGDILDIHKAGLALFSIQPERREEYDAVFRAVFLGQAVAAAATGDEDDELQAHEPTGGTEDAEAPEEELEIGEEATAAERLGHRALSATEMSAVLTHFQRTLPSRLPQRRSHRRKRAKSGDRLDMRRILREAARYDGDVVNARRTVRKARARKVLMLVDVSGSMEAGTEATLRLAHKLVQGAERAEVFTIGTRLTRVTPALAPADEGQALARASALIADVDGGTRLGAALQAFLNIPRYAVFSRGAAVVIVSDGLERDEPQVLIDAARRLTRLAWHVAWLSPLVGDPAYRPATAAMQEIAPMVALGDGSNIAAVSDHILNLARRAA